jgi:hypothetical protein
VPGKETEKGTNGTKDPDLEDYLTSSRSLYQCPKNSNEKWTWVEKELEDVDEAANNEETAQHALITRLQKANDSRKKFEIRSTITESA